MQSEAWGTGVCVFQGVLVTCAATAGPCWKALHGMDQPPAAAHAYAWWCPAPPSAGTLPPSHLHRACRNHIGAAQAVVDDGALPHELAAPQHRHLQPPALAVRHQHPHLWWWQGVAGGCVECKRSGMGVGRIVCCTVKAAEDANTYCV